jgi:hypothetical protein
MGIGTAMDKMAMRETVKGNPNDFGHQLRLYKLKTFVIHINAVTL